MFQKLEENVSFLAIFSVMKITFSDTTNTTKQTLDL